jgi:hypothetical protein
MDDIDTQYEALTTVPDDSRSRIPDRGCTVRCAINCTSAASAPCLVCDGVTTPATGILHVLDQSVSLVGGDRNLDIHEQDYATFRELRSQVLHIQPALLATAKPTKGKGGETDEE